MHEVCFEKSSKLTSGYRLGDSIVLAAYLAHLGSVRVYSSTEPTGFYSKVLKLYDDKFEVEWITDPKKAAELKQEKHWVQRALEDNVKLIKPRLLVNKENYVTTQMTRSGDRSVDVVVEGEEVKKLDSLNCSMPDLFTTIAKAKEHYGCESGCCWVAASCGVPSTMIIPKDRIDNHFLRFFRKQENCRILRI